MKTFLKICTWCLIICFFSNLVLQPNFKTSILLGYTPSAGTLPLLHTEYLKDSNIKAEIFATGLNRPTNMAFLSSGDVLVLEKDNGTVRKIVNGSLLMRPILDVNVSTFDTRGMLGIAVTKNESRGKEYVFLYFTKAGPGLGDGKDICKTPSNCIDNSINQPLGNFLYRFDLSEDGATLINGKLLLNFSALPGATHNGGEIVIGPDNNIYLITGNAEDESTVASNSKNSNVDGKAGILALDHDGRPAFRAGILGKEQPLNKYYAYGIRNGFGLDFDPVTGKLWDTENGPDFGDELNLVEPGFNSGWNKVQGIWENNVGSAGRIATSPEDYLVLFNGKGMYSVPEFIWYIPVGVSALKFLDTDKYGEEYKNDLFVATGSYGDLYHFDLTKDRNGLELKGPLADRIGNTYEELSDVIFGYGSDFGLISDITLGPDGYLYIVSFSNGEIYRLVPAK